MNNSIVEERTVVNEKHVKSIIIIGKQTFHINSHFCETVPLTDALLEIAKNNLENIKDTD